MLIYRETEKFGGKAVKNFFFFFLKFCYLIFLESLLFLWKSGASGHREQVATFKYSVILSKRQNFEQWNFGMADISNLKINECENVEQPELRINIIENKIYIRG